MHEWRLSAVFTGRSGRPFSVFASANNGFVGPFANALPDRLGNGRLKNPSIDRWFDGSLFLVPNPPRAGSSGRNIVAGPALPNLDVSAARTIMLSEGRRLQLRWEVFNVTNTPQFALPARDASNPDSMGRITELAGDPRTMQLAIKIQF